jgi:cysteine desulfurase
MENPIYLDYNATTPIDPEVAQEMNAFIKSHFGNPSSSYAIGRFNKDVINLARKNVADLINANPDEIIFTSCATESNNMSILGVLRAQPGKHVITSAIEHPSVIEVCKNLESQGYKITYLPVDRTGRINLHDVEKAIRPDTALITIMHANNEVGTIQPIREIAVIAKKHNKIFHTDAAQSAAKIETDVSRLGVDLLTIAGHKLYAPKGIGALYLNKGINIKNIMYGASQEKGLRPGTENVIHIIALGKACEIAKRDFDKNYQTMLKSRNRLLDGLKSKPGVEFEINGDLSNSLPNTISLAFNGIDAHTLASLIGNEINLSTGSACHADSIEISPVLKAMGVDLKVAAGTVRISTGRYTTNDEIDAAVEIITKTVIKLKPNKTLMS